jgi:acetyltransferase
LVLASWVGGEHVAEARRLLADHRVPSYETPEQAVRAFMVLVRRRRGQQQLAEAPPSIPEAFAPDTAACRALVAAALAEGRAGLTEPEAKRVIAAYGVPVVATRIAESPEAAAALAAEIAGPVALKILSPDIVHKSDCGGVALDLDGPAAVLDAARDMLRRVAGALPEARIQGLTVAPMARRAGARELIVGATEDPQFGPVILVGHGGTEVEAVADRALALPPLSPRLARDLLARTRIHRVLRGVRGQPPADLDAIARTIVRVSQLVIDIPEIRELDINPLLVDAGGVLALDARIALARPARPGSARLAIRPYPTELEETLPLADGQSLRLRPIRPEDEPMLCRALPRLGLSPAEASPADAVAARLSQIDYDREMTLILTDPGPPGRAGIHGLVRLIVEPDDERAELVELAIAFDAPPSATDLRGLLIERILGYARRSGIREVRGAVARDDRAMLALCERLGFEQRRAADQGGLVPVVIRLEPDPTGGRSPS